MMTTRYNKLSKRRGLEAEGFNTDINMLRQQLRGLEMMIVKGNGYNDNDDEFALLNQGITWK